jgi:hypothetical protein
MEIARDTLILNRNVKFVFDLVFVFEEELTSLLYFIDGL